MRASRGFPSLAHPLSLGACRRRLALRRGIWPLLALLLAAVLAGPSRAAEPPAPAVLTGLDPVLLVEGREVAGSAARAATHGKFRYLFASEETRARFLADPGRFAVANDGRCAAMPGAEGSPDLFAVHGGKVYLFGSPGCREAFLASPAVFTGEVAKRKVAIVVFDGVELLDFAGPGEVFAAAGHGVFEVFTVGASREPVVSQGFVEVIPRYAMAEAPKPDVLVLPGGGVRSLLSDPAAMAWVKASAAKAEVVMSVCNGAFVLAEAGLLEGLSATTHWAAISDLRRAAPATRVVEGERFVDNGRIVTAAGVSAGIDAALHVVARLLGAEQARGTARYMEYAWSGSGQKPEAVAAGSSGR